MLVRGGIELLTADQWAALHAPFPAESLSADTSRGFERLNEVFEPCGIG